MGDIYLKWPQIIHLQWEFLIWSNFEEQIVRLYANVNFDSNNFEFISDNPDFFRTIVRYKLRILLYK